MISQYTDEELIYLIRHSERSRTRAMSYIYNTNLQLLNSIERILAKGTDRKFAVRQKNAVYHLAITTLVEKILVKTFNLQYSLNRYLRGITVNLCKQVIDKSIRRKTNDLSGDSLKTITAGESLSLYNTDWRECVSLAMRRLKAHCQRLLQLRMKQYSFKEISEIMGYKDDTTARVMYARCKKTLIQTIENDADLKKRLEELLQKD